MIKKLAALLVILLSLKFQALAQEIYVIDDGNAQLYKVDVSHPNQKVLLKSTIGRVGGMVIDNNIGVIYYTRGSNSPNGQIIRVVRDGSNETIIATGLSFPGGLTLDTTSSTLYFIQTDATVPSIYKMPLSANIPVIVVTGTASAGPVGLDIDILANQIYWTDSRDGSIRRANTDGTNEVTVANGITGNLSGISVDALNGNVYWIRDSQQAVQFVSMSASFPAAPQTAVSDPLIAKGGLEVDTGTSPVTFYIANNASTIVKAVSGGSTQSILELADGVAQPVDLGISVAQAIATPVPTPGSQILAPGTQITVAPDVVINGKTATITLLNFTSAINAATAIFERASAQKLQVRYDVKITAEKKKDSQKILSKKNVLTAKNLKPGNYTVSYSAVAYAKKLKSQVDKAKAAGKTEFTDLNKKVFSTNISPGAAFTIQ